MSDYADKGLKAKVILPFATSAANRLKDFTKDMEMAAIVYLAESNRKKGEGSILKKPDEKLVFITKACYPIWLVPCNRVTLLFDGLSITSHTLAYDVTPDIDVFSMDIQESQKTTEAYIAALARNADYFENFSGREEESIEALIATPDLIDDFTDYFSQIEEARKPATAAALLTPTVSDREIQAGIDQLLSLRKRANEDIERLDAGMKLLNAATRERIKAAREEVRKTQEMYDRQLAKTRPRVTREISRIRNEYSRQIARTAKESRKRLQRLRKSQANIERTVRHLRTEAKRCETRIRSSKRRKKRQKETRWTLKLKRIKKKLPSLEKEVKDTTKKMRKIEAAQRLEAAQQKAECDVHIEAANKMLQDLQASKEAEVAMKRQEIATVEDTTFRITNQMLELAKTKKAFLEDFDELAMPGRKQEPLLVHVPFYLVRYETDDQRRYTVYPPSIVGDMGTLTKMKGALGAAKMKALLRPRSRALTAFLSHFVTLIEKNPMLEKEVTEAGIESSILLTRQLRIGVKKGLQELENEDWISENEFRSFSDLLYVYV